MSLARTQTQAQDALTGNGTAVDAAGANAIIFVVDSRPTSAAGILTFEVSYDDGANWSLLAVEDTSTGAALAGSASAAARTGFTVISESPPSGDIQVRARISTAFTTASPKVLVYLQQGN